MTENIDEVPRITVAGELQKFPDGMRLVHDAPLPETKPEPAPPGKTRLADGSLIDSIDRMYVLAPAKEDPRVLSFGDGKTFYTRDAHGALRRLSPKGKK